MTRPRMRLDDKLIGPVLRRLLLAAGEAGLQRPITYRVLGAVVAMTIAWNRVEDTVALSQLQYYAGLSEGQAGRANVDGAKQLKAALRELADAGLVEVVEPARDAADRAGRGRRWWIAIPERYLDPSTKGVGSTPSSSDEGGRVDPVQGGRVDLATGSGRPRSRGSGRPRTTIRSSPEGTSDARMRARPTADGQRHLVFDPPAEADPDTDPWSALVARLADSGELDVVVELARAGDHPEVADVPDLEEDQPGLHRAVREVCEELDPDSLPPVRGLEAVQRLPGPLAHRVLTQALPIARAQLSADTNGVVRPLSDRPDDPVLADHLDIACQTVLDQLTKGA